MYNPCIRGWIAYYGHFYKDELRPTLRRIDAYVRVPTCVARLLITQLQTCLTISARDGDPLPRRWPLQTTHQQLHR